MCIVQNIVVYALFYSRIVQTHVKVFKGNVQKTSDIRMIIETRVVDVTSIVN
jgi:hypothetical protein